MKKKSIMDHVPKDNTGYLGHFKQEKWLKEGHNFAQFIPIALAAAKGMKEMQNKADERQRNIKIIDTRV